MAVAGLIGSVLTLYPPVRFDLSLSDPVRGPLNDVLSGVWFGAALAVYFLIAGSRSLWRPVALSIISLFTWQLAFRVVGFAFAVLTAADNRTPSQVVAVFGGGAFGALAMSTTTFGLYAEPEGLMRKQMVCAMAGGLLGVAGFVTGDKKLSAMFILWQTGLALLMGLIWPGQLSTTVDAAAGSA